MKNLYRYCDQDWDPEYWITIHQSCLSVNTLHIGLLTQCGKSNYLSQVRSQQTFNIGVRHSMYTWSQQCGWSNRIGVFGVVSQSTKRYAALRPTLLSTGMKRAIVFIFCCRFFSLSNESGDYDYFGMKIILAMQEMHSHSEVGFRPPSAPYIKQRSRILS